ncbi:MAG: chromosomal replication initiator protein DnaA [Bacteroidetes bacterium]|jgi:chromosomal replication initiator protein|nr:chromosomal replication initiator protein DnaA [Bacteroidota bacterium]
MEQSPESVWQACLEIVRDNINRQSYKTWFEPLKAVKLEEEEELVKLTVQLPSRFYYEWLEEHYFGLLRKTITKVLGPKGRLFYNIVIEQEDETQGHEGASMHLPARRPADEPRPTPNSPAPGRSTGRPDRSGGVPASASDAEQSDGAGVGGARQQERSARPQRSAPPAGGRSASGQPQQPPQRQQQRGGRPQAGQNQARQGRTPQDEQEPIANPFVIPGIRRAQVDSQLNNSYTFDRFIEGDCNRLARSASLAIAQQPGTTSFNPFLLYGGVGLGKTHLMQAIGNYVQETNDTAKVLYVSSERFTTEFVQSIQHNRVSEFSLFYRQIDVLIIDDVQFFGGKEKTQEEFFHIFNALHQNGKQIVMSADRSPRDIDSIEERLLSRFNWGLSADLQPPELETRIAILQRKAEDDGIEIDPDVITFVATHVKSNIRELEGALIRLLAHATLHNREIDLPLAKEVLRDLISDTRVNLTIEEIQRIVCNYFNIEEDLVRARTRKREVVEARKVAMYFCKELTQHSLKTIGLHFGGRDHSTVIHANRSVEDRLDTDPQFEDVVEEVRTRIDLGGR